MAFRDRTHKFISYRDLNFAGSLYRRQAARRVSGVSINGPEISQRSSRNRKKPWTRTNEHKDYVAVTVGEIESSDGDERDSDEAHCRPIWMDIRDQVNNYIYTIDGLLGDLRQAHRADLDGFRINTSRHTMDSLAEKITAHLKEADKNINMIYPKTSASKIKEEPEAVVKRNVQTDLSQRLYKVTMRFRKQQKQFIRDKMALAKKKNKFENYFSSAAGDIELPPDASQISDAQLQSMAIEENLLSERDEQISKIARGIQEVAELFRDLANMTIEQGTVLDRIDNELDVTLENTKQGTQELVDAENYQKQMSKSLKYVAILVAIVTLEACLFIIKHTN